MRLVATNDTPIKDGQYPAVLVDVTRREGANGPYLLWTFEVDQGRGSVAVKRPTSTSFGPRSAARQIAEALLRRSLMPGEVVDTDDLAGRSCVVTIGRRTRSDGTEWPTIEAVTPAPDDDLADLF